MLTRILTFACGVLAGLLLRAVWLQQAPGVAPEHAAAVAAAQDSRCAAHPVKMPCLFDTEKSR